MIGGYSITIGLNPIKETKNYTLYQLYYTGKGRKLQIVEIKRFHDGQFRNKLWQYVGYVLDEDIPDYVLKYLEECIKEEIEKENDGK